MNLKHWEERCPTRNSINDPENEEKHPYHSVDNNPLAGLATVGYAGPFAWIWYRPYLAC